MKYATIMKLAEKQLSVTQDRTVKHIRPSNWFPMLDSIMVRGYVPINADPRCKECKDQ